VFCVRQIFTVFPLAVVSYYAAFQYYLVFKQNKNLDLQESFVFQSCVDLT